jgi:hypothetical protein
MRPDGLLQAPIFITRIADARADSTGRRNTLNQGGVYGTTSAVVAQVDVVRSDALTRRTVASPENRAAVLGANSNGHHKWEGC